VMPHWSDMHACMQCRFAPAQRAASSADRQGLIRVMCGAGVPGQRERERGRGGSSSRPRQRGCGALPAAAACRRGRQR
jgi:hypothetical protein